VSTKLSTIYQHWHPQRASTASTGIAVTGYQASIKMTRHTRTPYYSNSQLGRVTINQRYTDARKRKRVYSVCTPRTGHVSSVGPQASLSRQQHYKSKPKFFHRLSDTMHIPYATTRENQRSPYHPSPSLCSRQCPLPQS
jgi:hypothetical protein